MKTFEQVKKNIVKNLSVIQKKYNVKKIAIFGSYVRGEYKKGSDVDILVEFSKPVGFFAFLDLEEYLKKILGIKVDLVTKKALKPRIGKYILEEMVPL